MKHAMGRVKRLHFVGIGGAGMAPIAEILCREGYIVTGSDLSDNVLTQRLASLGVNIFQCHNEDNVKDADVLIYSSAINPDNPEFQMAKKLGIPILQRAQMLAELMRFREGIAVAGTHGKTTTTSLVASLLTHGGCDPTYVIGGRLNSSGAHASMGTGPHIVVEADESDASFLYLKPTMAIVTNIDADHMSTYDGDFNKLKRAFVDFLHHLPFYGPAALCVDDPIVAELAPQVQRMKIAYGLSDAADFQATDFKQEGMQSYFTIHDKKRQEQYPIKLNMPGCYNVQNALGAIAIARECGVAPEKISECLAKFAGVGRRLQCHGSLQFSKDKQVTLYDDYGHHPRELAVTVEALKNAFPGRRLFMVFQPHRYSRTQELFNDFVTVLSAVDNLILLPIYPASEKPIDGVNSESLAQAIIGHAHNQTICTEMESLTTTLQQHIQDNDVLLMAGAGSIGACAANLSSELHTTSLV